MKNLKPIIFTAHSELKSTITTIKKSYLYEAFAAFCGFKSYAAFQIASNVNVGNLELAKRLCFERARNLGFDAGESLQVCLKIQQIWEEYSDISVSDIYAFYSGASFEDMLRDTRMLDALSSFVDASDKEAALVGLVFTAQLMAEYDEDPDNRSGEYWYNKKIAKHKLNQLQTEVAERYQQIAPYREFFKLLLEKFESEHDVILPSPVAIRSVYEQFSVKSNPDWSRYFSNEPYLVIEAITCSLDYYDKDEPVIPFTVFLDWIKAEMLISPSRGGLLEIIETTNDEEEKWFWHFVGLHHDIDITQSNLRAIHADTGEDYDDYGPMGIAGDEGVSLLAISDEIKTNLENTATKLSS